MRVIAGSAKGTRLHAPKDRRARPTLDRVREALFSILGARVEGAHVLDLFAGTGAIGIEALSRGAARCVFVEKDREVEAIIHRNLAAAKVTERGKVRSAALPGGLKAAAGGAYDFVYADPPFDFTEYESLCSQIADLGLLGPEGILVIEHDSKREMPADVPGLSCTREAKYGRSTLCFFVPSDS